MNDCRINLEIRDGKLLVQGNVSMSDLVILCGYLERFIAAAAINQGLSIEDVKDHMLDMHIAAMQDLPQRKEKH